MIRDCRLLAGVQLKSFFGMNRLRHEHDAKKIRNGVLMAIVMVILILVLAAYSAGTAIGMIALGTAEVIPSLVLVVCVSISFITTFVKSNGTLFAFKDYDMVMSLPVSNAAVILSRVLAVYAMNLLFSAVAMVPALIVYGVYIGAGAAFWFMMVISLLCAPLLPMVVGMIFGALIAAISTRFQKSGIMSTILSIIFICVLMVVLMNANNYQIEALEALGETLLAEIPKIYPPAALLTGALAGGSWSSLGWFTGISLVAITAFIAVLAPFYKRINSALFARRTRSNFKLGEMQSATPFTALYKKELKRLFTGNVYFLNTGMGAILSLLFSGAMLFFDPGEIAAVLEMPGLAQQGAVILPFIVTMFTVMSSSSSVSINLEGSARWIMASIPAAPEVILGAKVAQNLTFLVPASLISSVCLCIGFKASALMVLVTLLVPLAYALFIAVVGVKTNLRFARFDWTSEQQAVKQSTAMIVTMGIGFAVTLVPLFVCVALPQFAVLIALLVAALLFVAACLIFHSFKKVNLRFE